MKLHFEPVTEENRAAAEGLKLFPEQDGYIESVSECLAEADETDLWHPVGIYDGRLLTGFAMYGSFPLSGAASQVWLDRLLIDRRCQRHGYGKSALNALLLRLHTEYGCKTVYLSVYDSNQVAIRLYKEAGFRFNGELDTKGEKVMVYTFPSAP